MKKFLIVGLTLLVALMSSNGVWPSEATAQRDLPYTFFFTHYELLGDPNDPEGVRYNSTGKPFAEVPDGSRITLSGNGGWNPTSKTARGGGRYTIKDASGEVSSRGSWRVTGFSSFEQLDGWWGMGPKFKEKGWQGALGSPSFSGFLAVKVNLEDQGDGTLVAWCLMPEVLERHPHLAKPDGHAGDGISLTGDGFDFTDFGENEMSMEGVMFYSTDPASDGYVLTSDGHTIRNPVSDSPESSATATSGAAASASPLPPSGGTPLVSVLGLVATLTLVGSVAAAMVLLRRGSS